MTVRNRIKVIKRMAYGCPDNACFFLKINTVFTGKARQTQSLQQAIYTVSKQMP